MSMGLRRAFTLIELVVVIAIIAVLAALLFPALGAAKARAQRTVCVNNLHQISVGIHLYLDDQNNASPGNTNAARLPFVSWTDYRQFVNNYVGIKGASSAQDKVFACPADTFFYDMSGNGRGYVPQPMHEQADHAFTSYAFNAGQFTTPARTNAPATTNNYGIAGQRLETVPHPSRTVLLAEVPAYSPYSWHQPKRPFSKDNAAFADARDGICFVDGHVSYQKIYFDGKNIAWAHNPPTGYDYQWSGD
jgi:prepilin-type N-terminal cleavage/methylation domain-containing protein